MKVLIVGSYNVWSIEKIYFKHLTELGVEVEIFAAQNYFTEKYNCSILSKIAFKLGVVDYYKQINQQLIELVSKGNFDFIWIFKGMEIYPQTLQRIKKYNVHLVNYNPDNPFIFSGKGSGNRNVTDSIDLYDFYFTYNLEVKKEIEGRLQKPVYWLPFGFEVSEAEYQNSLKAKEVLKVCFVGNPDENRVQLIKAIAAAGFEVDVYGHGWHKVLQGKNITCFDAVYLPQVYSILRKYRVQLNPLRPHNKLSHGMRTFEVPSVGGIMLTEDTPEHRIFFEEGKDIFLYTDINSCISQIEMLLNLNKNIAYDIRLEARKKSLSQGYDYKSRSISVKKIFEKHCVFDLKEGTSTLKSIL
ncbi:MAG TPA: hypothetical protein DCQ29_12670 [Chitinophagaceae bacterium]|nr:hypothetical protein [Chitinophagaceae bacterium]